MTMSIVTSAVEVGLVCILEVVLDVTHLVVHSDEVLLVDPRALLDAKVLTIVILQFSLFSFPISYLSIIEVPG